MLAIESAGGTYYIARSFETFVAWYQDLITNSVTQNEK